MAGDLRVCFVGDSFVAGTGDEVHLGWVGRLATRSRRAGRGFTAYNLGVRRHTTAEVLRHWEAECEPRLPAGCDNRVVCSFGVNDTTWAEGRCRVPPAESCANLSALVQAATARRWDLLVVGPPPIGDRAQNERIESLDEAFAGVCRPAGVGYVTVFGDLRASAVWMSQVDQGDGAHPGSEGYRQFADLVWPTWARWVSRRAGKP